MENTEIMNNEVAEAAEEIIDNVGSNGKMKTFATVGISMVMGVIIYNYAVKPMAAKVRNEIERRKQIAKEKTIIVVESDAVAKDN